MPKNGPPGGRQTVREAEATGTRNATPPSPKPMAMKSRPQRGTNDWMRLGRHSLDSSASLLVVSISVSGLPWNGDESSCCRREYAEKNDDHQKMIERPSRIAEDRGRNGF